MHYPLYYPLCLLFSLLIVNLTGLSLHLCLQPLSVLLTTRAWVGGMIIFSTVKYQFPYSQCLQLSLLSVELKSPLSKFCALLLNLTILLLKLGIFLLEFCALLLNLAILLLELGILLLKLGILSFHQYT